MGRVEEGFFKESRWLLRTGKKLFLKVTPELPAEPQKG